MIARRLLAAVVLGVAGLGALTAPTASADQPAANLTTKGPYAACMWLFDEGLCVGNPFDDLPTIPKLP